MCFVCSIEREIFQRNGIGTQMRDDEYSDGDGRGHGRDGDGGDGDDGGNG